MFIYGFPKSAKANLSPVELDVYRKLAQIYLSITDADMAGAQIEGELEEVHYEDEEEKISD